VDQKLHERLPHKLGRFARRQQHVQHTVEREQDSHFGDYAHFLEGAFSPETGHAFIPNNYQQV
jgi:hypothetical protein